MQTQFIELSDSQWEVLKDFLPVQRRRKYCLREVVNVILWVVRTGCQWRNIKYGTIPWKSVYYYFFTWSRNGIWEQINTFLVEQERISQGREAEASLVCADSQSVKAGPFIEEERGIDGNKRVNGRKRHVIVDVLGLILGVLVGAANKPDGKEGIRLLEKTVAKFGRLKKILVDGVYAGAFQAFGTEQLRVEVEISSRPPSAKGFVPIKKRWVVERTFGWLNFFRRLDKDHEKTTKSSESVFLIAHISILLARLGPG